MQIKPGEVAQRFGVLGLTSFGGPTAHLGYFREEFVTRRAWLTDRSYADVVAVSQFLPGAGSSQVGMALGYHRGGWAGMAAAWLTFTLPSALVLAVFGLWLADADPATVADAGWIRGLLATAVAVVFHAVAGMAKNLAAGPVRASVAVAAALTVLLAPSTFTHLLIIAAAGVLGTVLLRAAEDSPAGGGDIDDDPGIRQVSARAAGVALLLFFLLLIGLWLGAQVVGGRFLTRSSAFFETGALVFGGGHVVMPLLQAHAVDGGWMSQETFLAGYSAAQAVPGPLFTFATYVGAVDGGAWGAVWATVMIFLPSALLMIAGLHFWGRWRHTPWLRAAFTGINAAVVGLLLAAFWDPVLTHGVTDATSLAVAAICWLMLAQWKLPPWSVAAFGAVAGLLIL
ncbi:chromate efflux transporter [Corynebacterium guangdongense]|uniref:Chromate transporter n=1 Tax=Corynebacterium guangdongense TaxID=1783348 RepID=A0ABU1ZZE1_9CORY|nr:chromate efflux transporter [Corynebacterium guangdongense]MDR7330125.1 chromate transporter [Corynebacterium guangdongense]WJZ18683.1 putative chromate transport protein [Corynebacterium guangdongense]